MESSVGAVLLGFVLLAWSPSRAQNESDYRLPNHVRSLTYELFLSVGSLGSGKFPGEFHGESRFTFQPIVESLDSLVLNSEGLEIDYSAVELYTGSRAHPVSKATEDAFLQRVTVHPARPLAKGKVYTLRLNYTGPIRTDSTGLFKSTYLDEAGNSREVLGTQLRPVYTRRLFPCLDEPGFRAKIRLSVEHPASAFALSSMPVEAVSTQPGGGLDGGRRLVTSFYPTPEIPAYLVGLVVGELPSVKGQGGFTAYAVPSKAGSAAFAALVGPPLAAAMAAHTSLPYSLNKTDLVALPAFGPVAMENWGLYTFRESNMLYTEGSSRTIQKEVVARFVGHEVAHAWMGNPVTIKWWDYLWLSEVFAMYYEYYLPGKVEPTWRMMDQLVLELHQPGLLMDSVPSEPLTTRVLTPAQITAKFSGLTYSKGPALLRMVINVLTEPYYIKAFSAFLEKNAYSSVEPDDLWNALDKDDLPAPLSEIMNNWTTLSGYPVVDVKRGAKGDFVLTQSTFTRSPTSSDEKAWWIPLSFTTSAEKDFKDTRAKAWFPPKRSMKLRLPLGRDDWVIFNIRSTGFMRVNYDGANWLALSRQLFRNHEVIGAVNRASLLDDSLNLARSGRLDYKAALDLACYLVHERSYVPWASALNAFAALDDAILHQTELRSKFLEYVGALVEGVYEELAFDGRRGEPHLAKLLKEIIVRWACRAANRDCVKRSLRYVSSLAPGRLPERLSPDVRETALCTGVAEGGDTEWGLILSLYKSATNDDNRRTFLSSLACSKEKSKLKGLLVESMNQGTNESDWGSVLNAVARRKENAESLLDFLTTNYGTISSRFGSTNFENYVNQIHPFLTTKLHLEKLKNLESLAGIDLTKGKESVTSRVSWMEKYCPQLKTYFDQLMKVKSRT